MATHSSHDELFAALGRSSFRRRFRLGANERRYLEEKGLPMVLAHAREFVAERLAPAQPKNDGRQTPMRGHPAFIAQHATATCCRGCLAKWHHIPKGAELTPEQLNDIVGILKAWLKMQLRESASESKPAISCVKRQTSNHRQDLFDFD
jgi:hypothetical protein